MADNATTVDDTSTAYVVYVPPSGTDKTVESCLRLGVGPTAPTTDEWTTYSDFVSASSSLSGLSASHYNTSSGIALVTPGTINLLAAGAVNTVSGTWSSSTIGSSYTITQDPSSNHVITASYTNDKIGAWTTSAFNQASTVQVSTCPIAAQIALGTSYQLTGPISFTNNYGVMFSSTVGVSVAAQLARVVDIGWRTIVSYAKDGSNNEYYTQAQASSTGAGFSWTVPVPGGLHVAGSYTAFDAFQNRWCKLVNAAAVVADLTMVAYAAAGLGIARNTPSDVQGWLDAAAPMAVTCTALDGILAALGLLFGYWMDAQASNPVANADATNLKLSSGTAVLQTKAVVDPAPYAAPTLKLDAPTKQALLTIANPLTSPRLQLGEATASLRGKTGKAKIEMDDSSLILGFGDDYKITLSTAGITLAAPGHNVVVSDSEISIAGNSVVIDALQQKIDALTLSVTANTQGLAAETQARTFALQGEATARDLALQAEATARTLALQAETQARTLAMQTETAARIEGDKWFWE